jgi:hypothetical protein
VRSWGFLLGGLVVWTVHFFTLYGIASIFLTTPLARVLTLVISLACLAANAFLFLWVVRADGTGMDRWARTIALYALGVSTLAIVWQALPAVLI